jgi:4-amino-4-deoxy-L-arabinose transferase-like glycosyltransferase
MTASVFRYNILITVLAIMLFIPFLGSVHLFDWDEINFAECAREMIVTHNYFSVKINFQPFWEKPPLFIWMQALSMNIFGINEFAARLPNGICGIVTLLLLFNIGRKIYNNSFGLLWTLIYAGSFLPHFYFKSGIIDPWFNVFIFSGIYCFIRFTDFQNQNVHPGRKFLMLILSASFIGLGILTKGPVALLVFSLCVFVYWIINRLKPIITIKQILLFVFTCLFVGGIWFIILILTGNSDIIKEFFLYQVRLFSTEESGHGGPFFYHWIVLLIGCFPLSIFALRSFKSGKGDSDIQRNFKLWMLILFWVVLILFSIVKTKILHYSSLCYFPLSFLSTYVVFKLWNREMVWKKWTGILLMTIAILIGTIISILPLIDRFKQKIIDLNIINDKFAVENMKANVHWSGYESLIGILLILGIPVMLLLIKRNKIKIALAGIFIISLLVINLSMVLIVPRIEKYSQGAAIDFYESLKNKDCYITTLGFKSYAQFFYSAMKPHTNPDSYQEKWLLSGAIDKPVYFVCKTTYVREIIKNHPELKKISEKNGFVFFLRVPGN